MDLYSYVQQRIDAIDATFAVVLIGIFGLPHLIAAFDGCSVHGFGLLGNLNIRRRYYALISGNVIIISALAIVYYVKGVTPFGVREGASQWWNAGAPIGYVISIVAWCLFLSPILSLIALYRIERLKRQRNNPPMQSARDSGLA